MNVQACMRSALYSQAASVDCLHTFELPRETHLQSANSHTPSRLNHAMFSIDAAPPAMLMRTSSSSASGSSEHSLEDSASCSHDHSSTQPIASKLNGTTNRMLVSPVRRVSAYGTCARPYGPPPALRRLLEQCRTTPTKNCSARANTKGNCVAPNKLEPVSMDPLAQVSSTRAWSARVCVYIYVGWRGGSSSSMRAGGAGWGQGTKGGRGRGEARGAAGTDLFIVFYLPAADAARNDAARAPGAAQLPGLRAALALL